MKKHINQIHEKVVGVLYDLEQYDKEYKYPLFNEFLLATVRGFAYLMYIIFLLPIALYFLYYTFLTLHISTGWVFDCVDKGFEVSSCVQDNLEY